MRRILPLILGIFSGIIVALVEIILFTSTNDFSFMGDEFYLAIFSWYLCQGVLYGLYCLLSLPLINYLKKLFKRPRIDLSNNYNYYLIFILFFWLLLYLPLNRPNLDLPVYLTLFRRRMFYRWLAALLVFFLWLFLKKQKARLKFKDYLFSFFLLIFSIFSFVHLFRLYYNFLRPAHFNPTLLFLIYQIGFLIYVLGVSLTIFKIVHQNKLFRLCLLTIWVMFMLTCNTLILKKIFSLNQKEKTIAYTLNKSNFNIIFIVLDTARAKNMSVYGYPIKTTPFLEEFSQEAIVYDNCVSTANATQLSHAAMFTGIYPSKSFGLFELNEEYCYLDERFMTLAEALSHAGYQTAFIVSNYLGLHPSINLSQGFQCIDCIPKIKYNFFFFEILERLRKSKFFTKLIFDKLDRYDSLFRKALIYYSLPYREAEVLNRNILKWLVKERNKDFPFFLFINYMDTHAPYFIHQDSFVFDKNKSALKVFPQEEYDLLEKRNNSHFPFKIKISDAEKNRLEILYNAELTYLDFHLSRLINFLKNNGLYDNSLIIITSDHGEALGEHDNLTHGFTLYQEELWVPLLIKYPSIFKQKPQRIEKLVQTIDLFPTILSLLDIKISNNLDAINLEKKRDFAISEGVIYVKESGQRYKLFSLFKDNYKLISSNGSWEFYNLNADFQETQDIADQKTGLFMKLKEKLDDYKSKAELLYPKDKSLDALKQEEILQLKALGYLQ